MATFVGIDLGTTNSVVAHRDRHGRPEVIPNREGANITPSVVYFGTEPPAVGHEAKEYARLGDSEIASFFKPHMGSALYQLQFGDRTYDATDLSAIVLKRLKEDAEAALGEEADRAVITVPAYFGDAQRKATIEAGEAAGFRVLRIVNEPTAATLAYGLNRGDAPDETVLIYDLGGGTFDVTVARIAHGDVAVLSTAGDHDLGGKNWDDRIATFLSDRFAAETGFDPLDDPVALNEVLVRSEQAKWALSERAATRITLQLGAERKTFELSRAEFEAMTAPLMDRTRRLTEEALGEANLDWRRLDGVLLVGGSTRMPMVRSYVAGMAGKPPRTGVNVDEVVALGAAVQAAIEVGESIGDALPRFTLGAVAVGKGAHAPAAAPRVTDVMSHSLGTIAVSADGSAYQNDIVIRRNLPIPARNTKTYLHATHGGANSRLEVYLTQGESESPLDCTILGKYVFDGISPTDAEVMVDVGLSYDANGVVQVSATQRDTGHRLALEVEPVPDDMTWLALPPAAVAEAAGAGMPERIRVILLMDVSSSMIGGPLAEAQTAAREFLDRCDFTTMEVGLISFSSMVALQCAATSNVRRLYAAVGRLEAEGSTNLTDALEMARGQLAATDARRYIVMLTDGFPDAPESAVEQALAARQQGIEVVAIGTGDADREYLGRLASSERASIFARSGELVQAFGHIARMIAEGGRGLRVLS
ncbi:Chaperone protein DnaK [Aquisphaera giovannonii]|uniref:Chaperone protein DnaK n=1 Tax=Aquisphaera giovannonii TaxID=406548 RepID=A0A5B9WCI3_9BACT|nr:Hsp70 family protein [Aquisphaera giovannonii]QEH37939.1 Chaperone protein DnaK [Aquisphaera giovannonii]